MRADPAVEQVHSCPTVKFETPTRCAGPLRLSAHTQQRGVSPGNRQLQAPLASSSSRRVKADAAIASSSRAAREQTPSHAKRHMALEKSKRSVAPATPHVKSGYLAEVAVEELSGCQRTNIDAMEARDLRPHVLATSPPSGDVPLPQLSHPQLQTPQASQKSEDASESNGGMNHADNFTGPAHGASKRTTRSAGRVSGIALPSKGKTGNISTPAGCKCPSDFKKLKDALLRIHSSPAQPALYVGSYVEATEAQRICAAYDMLPYSAKDMAYKDEACASLCCHVICLGHLALHVYIDRRSQCVQKLRIACV